MGLYQNIVTLTATLAGCGLANSGVRQLAASSGDAATLATVRRALWAGNLTLGLSGMFFLWMLREPTALWIFGDNAHAEEIGWLGCGVFLNLVAASQTALLRGLRRIGDLARVTIIGAVLGAIVGIALIYVLGADGVVWFVLTTPLLNMLVASHYAARLPRPSHKKEWKAIQAQWQAMLRIGIPFMAAAFFNLATQLAARSIVLREFGIEATGYFQAAWTISMTYIGFVLGAMGSDYYPRLSEVIRDRREARTLVNDQTEIALLLAGPVLLAMITMAPWVIHLLYTDSFAPAAILLRWQVLGDIVKVSCWPMGFILLAQGRGGLFLATQLTWDATYLAFVFLGSDRLGLLSIGVGFFVAYVFTYSVNVIAAAHLIGYWPSFRNFTYMLALVLCGALIFLLSAVGVGYMLTAGCLAIAAVGVFSLNRLDTLLDIRAWLRRKVL